MYCYEAYRVQICAMISVTAAYSECLLASIPSALPARLAPAASLRLPGEVLAPRSDLGTSQERRQGYDRD